LGVPSQLLSIQSRRTAEPAYFFMTERYCGRSHECIRIAWGAKASTRASSAASSGSPDQPQYSARAMIPKSR